MTLHIPYVDAQVNFGELCDRVVEMGEAVIITRPDGKNVALVFEAELPSLLETLDLLRSPANVACLTTALERSKSEAIYPESINKLCEKLSLEEDN